MVTMATEYQRTYRKKKKRKGLCTYCTNKTLRGLKYCSKCKAKLLAYHHERIAIRRASGLCANHGVPRKPKCPICQANYLAKKGSNNET